MPAFRSHTPDEIDAARTLYEETAISPRDVAVMLGIGVNTFYRRVKHWGWRRRRLRVEEVDAMARAAAASRDSKLAALGSRILDDKRSSVDRAEAAILGQFDALQAMQERVALAAMTVRDCESAGRALQRLAGALVEVGRFRAEEAEAARRRRQNDAEDQTQRMRLRRQLEALRASEDAADASRKAAEADDVPARPHSAPGSGPRVIGF